VKVLFQTAVVVVVVVVVVVLSTYVYFVPVRSKLAARDEGE
jgi:hypothetical protein